MERTYLPQQGFVEALYVVSLLFAITAACLSTNLKIPIELGSLICGPLIGFIWIHSTTALHFIEKLLWSPRTIYLAMGPLFAVKVSYSMDLFVFFKSIQQIIIILLGDIFISSMVVGFVVIEFLDIEFNALHLIMIIAIYLPTAIPDFGDNIDYAKNLKVLMQAECIFTTSIAIFLVHIYRLLNRTGISKWYEIVALSIKLILASIGSGVAVGFPMSLLFKHMYVDSFNAVTTVILSSYVSFMLSETIAGGSGTLSVFITTSFLLRQCSMFTVDVDNIIHSTLGIFYKFSVGLYFIANCIFFTIQIYTSNTLRELTLGLGVYFISEVIRFILFLGLAPLLSRIGYGFDAASMITIAWSAKKTIYQFLIVTIETDLTKEKHAELCSFVFSYVALRIILNGQSIEYILRLCNLMKFSSLRQHNISQGLRVVHERGLRMITVIKMNRYYSDANWPLIQESIKIYNELTADTMWKDNYMVRNTKCPACRKSVTVEPTTRELQVMLRELQLRVLKTERVSYVRQFEKGMLMKEDIKALLQAVEVAMESDELFIALDDLDYLFKAKKRVERVTMTLLRFKLGGFTVPPSNKFFRIFYTINKTYAFEIMMYILNVGCILLVALHLWFKNRYVSYMDQMTISMILFTLFFLEFLFKVFALSVDNLKEGFISYFKNHWNKIDFVLLSIHFSDILICLVEYIIFKNMERVEDNESQTWLKILKFFRAIRLLKILMLCRTIYPRIIAYFENKIQKSNSYAFTLGRAMLVGYESVIDALSKMGDNELLRKVIKDRIDEDKLIINEQMANLLKRRPSIGVTSSTKQAIGCTLKTMKAAIFELKNAGFVDSFEFEKLMASLEERLKFIVQYKSIEPLLPRNIFAEVSWGTNDDQSIMGYIYENITTKIWKEGDVIMDIGQEVEGIFIIVAGVFKFTYKPQQDYLDDLKKFGLLPVRDIINCLRFDEEQSEFLRMGNSIGELAVLTRRPYSCKVISYTPSQAYVIPSHIVWNAIARSSDPIKGLEARMWKLMLYNLCKKILLETQIYQSMRLDVLECLMERSFIPNLNYYKILVLSNLVEDIVLIQGILVDFHSREIFTGPIYIPRTAKKLICPSTDMMVGAKIKVLFIPYRDIDEYEVMLKTEMLSEIIETEEARDSMVRNNARLAKRRRKIVKRKSGSSFSSNSIGSFTLI